MAVLELVLEAVPAVEPEVLRPELADVAVRMVDAEQRQHIILDTT